MRRIAFDRQITWLFMAAVALNGAAARAAEAQATGGSREAIGIVSSEIEISKDQAELRLALENGREIELAIRDDYAWIDSRRVGPASRGDALDRSWRELLNRAMDASSRDLTVLLMDWQAPGGEAGKELDRALEAALQGAAEEARVVAAAAVEATEDEIRRSADSVARLNERIADLERELAEQAEPRVVVTTRRPGRDSWYSPLRHVGRGIAGLLSTLAVYSVLLGLGFALVFFGRKYLEGVADTARHETVRAWLVGLAGSFLILPGFILGTIALAISIVGIPLLLVWLPLFPVAVVLAAIFGYLGVAHATGEALAERRFYGGEWFKRANSYYYLLTGVGLLLALFMAADVVSMAGPLLGIIRGLLSFLAVVLTWAVFTIGFGAVLLSRAGTRPRVAPTPAAPEVDVDEVFEEESRV